MISVLILTRNEQQDIAGAIESVRWSNDIHVFDSYSDDRTVEIALSMGACVAQRRFDNYSSHRNAALAELPFKNAWVLLLDADERATLQLSNEMSSVVESAGPQVAAFRMRRRDFLWNTWLKHAQMTPFYVRLVRPERVHYERVVNEELKVDGVISNLQGPLDHFPFSKGMSHWLRKHDVYSTLEAQLVASTAGVQRSSLHQAFFTNSFEERRRQQKALFYKLPGRPAIKWLYMMFVRGAVLDGRAGITVATLQAFYEYMIVVKTEELRRASATPPSTR